MEDNRPAGVTIFGVLLIASSLMHMHKLFVDHGWYVASYGYWPTWLMLLRYCFSWLQRGLGLIAAIDLLRLRNSGRILALAIAWFTILTIYWKHPYEAFRHHAVYLDAKMGFVFKQLGYPQLSFTEFVGPALILHYALDILFNGLMIFYLTRPSVKAHFKR